MCGLFGWDLQPGRVSKSQLHALAVMLADRNDGRGGDSWGYHIPMTKITPRGLGKATPQAYAMSKSLRLMGHTRRATTGDKTVPNSHPFEIGDIIGAHNGMISNHMEMNKKYERKHEVDSMHIFSHLAEDRGLEELEGYGTITFMNRVQNPGLIAMAKLRSGDLEVAQLPGKAGVVWSSLKNHLVDALAAAGIKHELLDIENEQVYYTNGKGELYIYKDYKLKISNTTSSTAGYYTGHHGWYGSSRVRIWNKEKSAWEDEPKATTSQEWLDMRSQWDKEDEDETKADEKLDLRDASEFMHPLYDEYWDAYSEFFAAVVDNGIGQDEFPAFREWLTMTPDERDDLIPTEEELVAMSFSMGVELDVEEAHEISSKSKEA